MNMLFPKLRWMACVAIAVTLAGCSKPPPPVPSSGDVAIDHYLRTQPDSYGAIARWAHQNMLADDAASKLAAQGFDCPPAATDATKRTCEKPVRDFASRFMGKVRADRVVIALKHPGPRIKSIEGMRYEDTSKGPVFTQEVSAPGVSFPNARVMADFVLDAHRHWHLRPYCFPAANPPGCTDERKARGEQGWRHWDGKAVPKVGNARESVTFLKYAGFSCDSDSSLTRRPVQGLKVEDDGAWLDCAATALDGQSQKVRLRIDPGRGVLELLRVSAGSSTIDIPVEPVDPWE